MKRGIICAFVSLAVTACLAQDAGPHPFIPKPARTPDALAKQIQANPVYMDRFVRHFQMAPGEVSQMVRSLRLIKLERDTEVEIFNVPSQTGVIRSKKLLLKRGTEVWADSSGTPVLKASCANPLTRTDEAQEPMVRPQLSQPVGSKELELPKGGIVEPVMAIHPIEPMEPIAPNVEFEIPPTITEVTTTGRDGAPFAGALLFLPTALIGFGGGGTPIPEPATIAALSAGLGLLALRRRKRK